MGETNSAERLNYLVPHFCISNLNVLRTQIFHHSLGFNAYCMGKDGYELFVPPLLYFNFKSFNNPDYFSFIRLQRLLDDSGVPFLVFSNFHKLKGEDLISWGESILQNG